MQFIEYTADSVRVYHNRIEHQGTPKFECGGLVPLAKCAPIYAADKTVEALVVSCPTCGALASVPLTGDTGAQRLHAHVRLADPKHDAQTLPDAIESVLGDVTDRGGVPSLTLALEALAELGGSPDQERNPILSAIKGERDDARVAEEARLTEAQTEAVAPDASTFLASLTEAQREILARVVGTPTA